MSHLVRHIHNPTLRGDNILHVVGVVTNPARYQSRYRLARQWHDEMSKTPNVEVHLVEAAYGDRNFELPSTLRLHTDSEIWIKENMINLGVRHLLPRDWKYVAWVDADISFRDPNWAQETLHQLQHFHVVQPWQQCIDLGFHGDILHTHQGFGYLSQRDVRVQRYSLEPYPYGHSGYAWACTRDFWEQAGGLMDHCILGSADHHMAFAMIGDVGSTVHGGMTESFRRRCVDWQRRAHRLTNGDVGFVNGRIEHHYHGAKAARKYRERWQILVDHKYDPDEDLVYDAQGMIRLVGKPRLEAEIRKYNRDRQEDSL